MNILTRTVAAALSVVPVLIGTAGTGIGVVLKEGPGKDKAMQCAACNSLDYTQMNSPFVDKAGWSASVNKMINVYSALIPKEDVEIIVNYLVQNYGKSTDK
jgi:hypothetical protein